MTAKTAAPWWQPALVLLLSCSLDRLLADRSAAAPTESRSAISLHHGGSLAKHGQNRTVATPAEDAADSSILHSVTVERTNKFFPKVDEWRKQFDEKVDDWENEKVQNELNGKAIAAIK